MKTSEFRKLIREEVSKVLNEEIEIISMSDAGVSNQNKSLTTKKYSEIISVLSDSEEWTDDLRFKDKNGNVYFIDDLIGKKVKIGNNIIDVIE